MDFLSGDYSFNKIRQFSFIVEYVYLAFLGILIIRKYPPLEAGFGLYWPLLINGSIALLYSIVLYSSGKNKEPTKIELVMRVLYLFMAGRLMAETGNPSVEIILALPTVIMALRYALKYTVLMATMTTFVVLFYYKTDHNVEIDFLFIFLSFVWVIGLLVNASMEVERQMQIERQKNQEREKLAAIGQMAAGIAHEVRNPLTTIKGFVQLLYRFNKSIETDMLNEYLQMIDKEIDRVNNLLKDFLQFAKPVKPKLSMASVNATIDDIRAILEVHCTSREIILAIDQQPNLPEIMCDIDQIKQVIINICLNAIDAMLNSTKKQLRIATKSDQESVYIIITDTGSGMTEEQKSKIFQPFFTTKDTGTGLGLSVCYSIINNHNGRILVNTEKDKGTKFCIKLPRYN